jgi:hypothetical protein
MTLALSGQEILHVWESGQGRHPIDQALIILKSAFPEMSRDALATLSIGQRDSYLLAVRAHTFGSRLMALTTCPQCREQVECMLDMAVMGLVPDIPATAMYVDSSFTDTSNEPQQVTIDGYEVHFRLPNSLDLAAIANDQDVSGARNRLVQSCIVQSYHDGLPLAVEALPEPVIETVTAQMAELDPLADMQLELSCAACGHSWQSVFDITTFLWREISTEAKRLLREVHILAQAYGWREADILSMSAARRQLYIEMVS